MTPLIPNLSGAMMRFGVYYDFRNPTQWPRQYEVFYQEVLEQVRIAEELGFAQAWISEHHFCSDGYTPSPMVWATALGMATERMRVGTNLMVLPLHEPVRIAEDAATVSLITGGRFDLGVGGGYREHEFAAFGRDMRHRPSLMEEGVEVIRRAWAGQPLDFEGRRFHYPDVAVGPRPEHLPNLFMGGMSKPAIDRVARIADGFLATVDEHHAMYVEALERLGKDPRQGRIIAGKWGVIAEDPEREWDRIGEHVLYQMNDYISQGAFGPEMTALETPDEALERGLYQLWDGPSAVSEFVRMATECPQIEQFKLWTLLPGEPVAGSTARLQYMATDVMPQVNEQLSMRATSPA